MNNDLIVILSYIWAIIIALKVISQDKKIKKLKKDIDELKIREMMSNEEKIKIADIAKRILIK